MAVKRQFAPTARFNLVWLSNTCAHVCVLGKPDVVSIRTKRKAKHLSTRFIMARNQFQTASHKQLKHWKIKNWDLKSENYSTRVLHRTKHLEASTTSFILSKLALPSRASWISGRFPGICIVSNSFVEELGYLRIWSFQFLDFRTYLGVTNLTSNL